MSLDINSYSTALELSVRDKTRDDTYKNIEQNEAEWVKEMKMNQIKPTRIYQRMKKLRSDLPFTAASNTHTHTLNGE